MASKRKSVGVKKVLNDTWLTLFGYDLKTMTKLAVVAAVVVRALILFMGYEIFKGTVPVLIAEYFESNDLNNQIASVEVSQTSDVPKAVGGSDYVIFTASWKPNFQDAYRVNGQEIFLTEGHERVRFDYSQPVPVGQSFRLDFALGGKHQGNLQFGRHSLYEVTIGDGDFKTVTIRSSSEVSNEISPQVKRESLDNEIVKDVANQLFITEKILSEKKMLIEIVINNQRFGYELDLPTRWKERDDVFFGLIDYMEGGNETSVYWIEPEIVGSINN